MSTVRRIEIRRSAIACTRLHLLTLAGLFALGQLPRNAAAEQATTPVVTTLLEVVNASGNTPGDPSDLLFEGHTPDHEPVLAPPYNIAPSQRQHLTLNDFDNVSGTGHIERVAGGTRLSLDVSGLIPNGVYSVWSDFYKAPGLTPDFANSIAFGAFGAIDGSQNTFIASVNGTAHFEGIQPPGPMSLAGNAPLYALDPPVSDYIVFLAYHINGQTYGGEPAPAGLEQTFVVHAMADFVSTIPEPGTLLLLALGLAAVAIATNSSARPRR
jgi:PEP-CTERM motif-containing protein